MGMTKSAIAAAAEATKDQQAADKFALDKTTKQAEIDARIAAAGRPIRTGSGAGSGPKPNYDIDTAAMIDKVVDLKRNPKADPNEIKALEDKIAGRTTYKTNVRDLPTNKKELEGGKLDLATADKAADAWGNMSGASKKSFAAANLFDVSRDPKTNKFVDQAWEEKARQAHAKSFKPAGGGANPPAKKVVNLDND